MRDPYSIYARHILKLDPIDPLEQDASAAEYGTVVHHALQRFIEQYPLGPLPLDAHAQLCAIGRERFAEEAIRPAVMAFWWPRFERIATWFIKQESARRAELIASHVEVTGALTLQGPAGRFELIARADRIDQLNGGLSIIDYKTGKPPSKKHIFAGFAPQLPLEAAIAVAGGFDRVPAMRVASLGFWQLHGRDEGGDASVLDGDIREIARIAREGLEQLIAAFDDPGTGYEAQPNPEYAPTYSDYLHLARVKEWAAAEDEE
jgi:ATP-dependent helicase/nuclease subunit B